MFSPGSVNNFLFLRLFLQISLGEAGGLFVPPTALLCLLLFSHLVQLLTWWLHQGLLLSPISKTSSFRTLGWRLSPFLLASAFNDLFHIEEEYFTLLGSYRWIIPELCSLLAV